MSATSSVTRTLAAIVMADVANYGQLMGNDEAQTVRTLQAYRKVFVKHIESRGGKVLDAKGDAIMAAFNSAVEAVAASVAIQQEIAGQNESLANTRRMRFRIGVNLGDVVEDDDTLYGDGVNIAGRLESLAEPGSVCISRNVHEQVEGKLPLDFEYLGEHKVKTETVHAYKVIVPDGAEMPAGNTLPGSLRRQRSRRTRLIAGSIIALILVLGGIFAWQQNKMPAESQVPPSIAVLPFENMSDDPEQKYFSDGLTEDIIARLARFPEFLVIARDSTSQYESQDDVRKIGRNLGAKYVIKGSVRKSGEMLRVTVQVFDADTGAHVWAETYDRDLTAANIFEIQDEITNQAAATIAGERGILWNADLRAIRDRPTDSLDAYECVLRAIAYQDSSTPEEHYEARNCLERAIETDPSYVSAWYFLAFMYLDESRYGFNPRPKPLERALDAARRAAKLDGNDAGAHEALALVYFHQHDLERFRAEADRAVALNANNAAILANIGAQLVNIGEIDRGSAMIKKAMVLNPKHPGWYYFALSSAEYGKENYDKALGYALRINLPDFYWTQIHLAAAYGQLGRTAEAKVAIDKLLELYPDFANNAWDEYRAWNAPEAFIRHGHEGLRKAGLDIPDKD